MTASLPPEVQAVFDRFITTELTTVDRAGQPITWPVTPYYHPGEPCIDVTTGLGYPKKANDAQANPLVSLLFSDPTGSGLDKPPVVLVQGSAEVDDTDLDANRRRYSREMIEKLPGLARWDPPDQFKRLMSWYYTRIYIHVSSGSWRWAVRQARPGWSGAPSIGASMQMQRSDSSAWTGTRIENGKPSGETIASTAVG